MRLQAQFRIVAEARYLIELEGRLFQGIETFHIRPLEANHVERQLLMRMRMLGIGAQPTFQPRTQVTEGKRARRILGEICLCQRIELLVTYDGAQSHEVLIQARKNAEPVRAAVDLEAFDGTQPVIRLDD